MLFGAKDRFAVEYDLENNHGKEWLFGKICYWINGKRIGGYGLGTSLRDVLFQTTYVLHYCGDRSGKGLCKLSNKKCFNVIEDALYNDGKDIENISDVPDEILKFNVSIPVDVFDGWRIFLVECDNKAKIMYREINNEICFFELEVGEFDRSITKFYRSLDSRYEREKLTGGKY